MTEEFFRPPPAMEAFVMAEFDRVRRGRRLRRWGAVAMSLAACVTAAFLLPKAKAPAPGAPEIAKPRPALVAKAEASVLPPVVTQVVKSRKRRRVPAKPDTDTSEFVRIPFTRPLGPSERASVMRMEMPVSALVAAGVPVLTADAGARAQADVVVGEDGLARAVRVISISNYKERYQ